MVSGAADHGVELALEEPAVDALLEVTPQDVEAADPLTFCRNVFVPLTTACRSTSGSCPAASRPRTNESPSA